MNQLNLRLATSFQLTKLAIAEKADDLLDDEQGEIGSWLILAAGLAVAAVFVVNALFPWFQAKVTAITAN